MIRPSGAGRLAHTGSAPWLRAGIITCASLLLSLLLAAAPARAQTITGKVIDPQNKPVANLEVLLHAVTGSSGRQVDRDTTNANGTFSLLVDKPDTAAIYFVAVTWNGQLFVGDMIKPPFPANQDYIVQVGVNPVEAGPATTTPGVAAASPSAPPPESDRTAGLVVVLVAALAIGGILFFALRRRPPARRRWLVQLARLEDEIESGGSSEALWERRTELRERLRAPQGG